MVQRILDRVSHVLAPQLGLGKTPRLPRIWYRTFLKPEPMAVHWKRVPGQQYLDLVGYRLTLLRFQVFSRGCGFGLVLNVSVADDSDYDDASHHYYDTSRSPICLFPITGVEKITQRNVQKIDKSRHSMMSKQTTTMVQRNEATPTQPWYHPNSKAPMGRRAIKS